MVDSEHLPRGRFAGFTEIDLDELVANRIGAEDRYLDGDVIGCLVVMAGIAVAEQFHSLSRS